MAAARRFGDGRRSWKGPEGADETGDNSTENLADSGGVETGDASGSTDVLASVPTKGPGSETSGDPAEAAFAVELPDRLAARWALGQVHSFHFALTPTRGGSDDGDDRPPPGVWIEAVDDAGRTARVALGDYGPLRPPLEVHILRRRDRERRLYNSWEVVLQTYAIPLGDFLEVEPGLSLRRLSEMRFVFDRTNRGEVVIDRIGISELHPGFWSARYR